MTIWITPFCRLNSGASCPIVLALEKGMQPNQNDAATSATVCLWCYSQYLKSISRAREGQTFCSRKCEIEAKGWLHQVLDTSG